MDKEMLQTGEAKHSEPNKAFDNLARILRKNFGNPDWNGPFLGKVVKGTYKASGTNKWTDELKVGDEVILNEFKNQKKFYLVDKAYYYNKAGG